jgi:hypothetical protein
MTDHDPTRVGGYMDAQRKRGRSTSDEAKTHPEQRQSQPSSPSAVDGNVLGGEEKSGWGNANPRFHVTTPGQFLNRGHDGRKSHQLERLRIRRRARPPMTQYSTAKGVAGQRHRHTNP